jgi:ABC-type molybdate transport system ATPase subunit
MRDVKRLAQQVILLEQGQVKWVGKNDDTFNSR